MTELVETVEQIIRNVETLHSFGNGNPAEQTFHDGRIKNGKVFVAVKRDNVLKFSPSKFAGYTQNDLSHEAKLNERDGRITNNKIEELLGPVVEVDSADYNDLDEEFLACCDKHEITPSAHHRARRYWLISEDVKREPSFYWAKVWGQPGDLSEEALLFNAKSYRDRAQSLLNPGDVVVYLTSDATHADPAFKGTRTRSGNRLNPPK